MSPNLPQKLELVRIILMMFIIALIMQMAMISLETVLLKPKWNTEL